MCIFFAELPPPPEISTGYFPQDRSHFPQTEGPPGAVGECAQGSRPCPPGKSEANVLPSLLWRHTVVQPVVPTVVSVPSRVLRFPHVSPGCAVGLVKLGGVLTALEQACRRVVLAAAVLGAPGAQVLRRAVRAPRLSPSSAAAQRAPRPARRPRTRYPLCLFPFVPTPRGLRGPI